MRAGNIEEEKQSFNLDPKVTNAIIDEIQYEFSTSKNKPAHQQNYAYLQLLVRAITNLLILDPE